MSLTLSVLALNFVLLHNLTYILEQCLVKCCRYMTAGIILSSTLHKHFLLQYIQVTLTCNRKNKTSTSRVVNSSRVVYLFINMSQKLLVVLIWLVPPPFFFCIMRLKKLWQRNKYFMTNIFPLHTRHIKKHKAL